MPGTLGLWRYLENAAPEVPKTPAVPLPYQKYNYHSQRSHYFANGETLELVLRRAPRLARQRSSAKPTCSPAAALPER